MQQRPWTVLMVCTGNICRSPLAQHLAVAQFTDAWSIGTRLTDAQEIGEDRPGGSGGTQLAGGSGELLIGSAGVCAQVGEPMHEHAAAVLTAWGVDPSGFRARALSADLVEASDLVLCATRQHRSAVVGLAPRALRRTFTLREFGRLTSGVRPGDIPAGGLRPAGGYLTATAWRMRASGWILPAEVDDLADPLNGGRDAFDACAQMIEHSLARPIALLAEADRRAAALAFRTVPAGSASAQADAEHRVQTAPATVAAAPDAGMTALHPTPAP